MCAVCPTTGVAVSRWIRARRGHSLQFIDSMRTSFHLFQTGVETGASSASATYQHRCNMFDYSGNAVRHTNHRAARGILFAGLRNDYSHEGGYGGRTVIMFNAFGPGDKCDNAHQQRLSGDVHVSIDVPYWWEWYRRHATDKIGVRLFATSGGALIFSNAHGTLPTVMSTACSDRVLMRYDIYQYGGDENMTGRDIPGCGKPWCEIWQSRLVDHCDPPREQVINGVAYHYSLVATLDDPDAPDGIGDTRLCCRIPCRPYPVDY
jgi:hypothetical protein